MTTRTSPLAKNLRAGKRVYGTLIVSTSPKWVDVIDGMGLDFVFIDTEHTAIDRTTLAWMCKAYSGINTPAIVRIPSIDPNQATQVIDAGAAGIIAPYVETPEQVRQLVGATKLRPLKGERLMDALDNIDPIGPILRDYLSSYNHGNILIVNIESKPALDNLEEILVVDGLDGILIGPHDLSISLGIPEDYHNLHFDEAVKYIIHKARSKNLGVGIHFSGELDLEIEWLKAGANLVVHNGDLNIFRRSLSLDLQRIRSALGEKSNTNQDDQQVII
jgi:2-keto-3-deoxy-L-rhamnonate aldolase RhmA